MPVTWRKAPTHRPGPAFIKVPPNKIICLLSKPHEHAVLSLHWDAAANGSFPCLGKGECRLHDQRSWMTAYAPALVWVPSAGRWVQGILPLGDPTHNLATVDLTEVASIVGKEKTNESRGRTIYYGTNRDDRIPAPPPVPTFDVRPFLLRRWGLFAEADLVGCEFHPPEQTLPFPEEKVS